MKITIFKKGIKLDFICIKMKLIKSICSTNFHIPKTTTDFTSDSMFSKSYVPFTCKFPMVMHFVLVLYNCSGSKSNSDVLVTI